MEETKVVTCSNTGLIQTISLIFLQEGNKKAPYVQTEKSLAKIAVARTLGTALWGSRPHKAIEEQEHHHCDARDWPQTLPFSQRMESAFCQRQKQGYDLASLYLEELWEKTKDIGKGMVRYWTPF